MPRDPEEKARFRGNDTAYAEGWERIFGKKPTTTNDELKEQNESTIETERETRNDVTSNVEGVDLRHAHEDVDSSRSDYA